MAQKKASDLSDADLQAIFDKMFNGGYVLTIDTMYDYIRNNEYSFKDDPCLGERLTTFFDDTYNG